MTKYSELSNSQPLPVDLTPEGLEKVLREFFSAPIRVTLPRKIVPPDYFTDPEVKRRVDVYYGDVADGDLLSTFEV